MRLTTPLPNHLFSIVGGSGRENLINGVSRADTGERREHRRRFLDDLLTGFPIQPVTLPIALRAGEIDGQTRAKGVRIPLSDLLIGASALELGY